MSDKPDGPIWVDMTDALMCMPIGKLVKMANLAMNRLSMRDWGEICCDLEITIDIGFTDEASHD